MSTHFAHPDSVSAMHGIFAVMCALEHRRRTGEGQRIHLSQLEVMVSVIGDVMMEALATGRDPQRLGNRSHYAAPHGYYPCAGEDRWCAIAVFDDSQWQRLCEVSGRWSGDERFTTLARRLENVEELDRALSEWTERLDAYDVQSKLQSVGVAAGVVQTTEDQREPGLLGLGAQELVDLSSNLLTLHGLFHSLEFIQR